MLNPDLRVGAIRIALSLALGCAVLAAARTPSSLAQPGTGWRLYGHDNPSSSIIEIRTDTGRASRVGPTGFNSGASAMAAAGAEVQAPGGRSFPAGTFFGLIGDDSNGRDYVTVSDPTTGRTERLVETSRGIGGRGVAFGPDGVTFYLYESNGELSTVDTVTGQVDWVGTVRDTTGGIFGGSSLELDPDSRTFLSLAGGSGGDILIQISPLTGRAVELGQIKGVAACTIVRAPAAVPGPGGVDIAAGTWMTIDNNSASLVTMDVDVAGRSASFGQRVGSLGSVSSGSVCGAAFAAPVAVPTALPTPTATASPVPTSAGAQCVCRDVRNRVPTAVIADAVANPQNYRGWRELLDPNKPQNPDNPPRECLTLLNRNVPYHPLWNGLIWRVGCP